ncbi:MAG TPA: uroporphyrinogen-III C-methyltransferase [Clostridiales bacterium]|nr:uroporphyrinogen-III C-methyltransferase [Clostridiales bacterium]
MKNGKVYLVGAGPGDYGLITVKGLETIAIADVLVYDRLINGQLISRAPAACEKIYVGKQAANHALPQDQINELLYQKAAAGKTVVRLKGGDPYVFGRGGEEGIYLAERGIAVETVPGITSSIAGPCYAGIPVTHRDWASSFHVFTGNFKDEIRGLDFQNLAALEGTLIFLMGFSNLDYITEGLLAAGKDRHTPVAVVSNATTARQKTAVGELCDIREKVRAENLVSPAITVIGDVVKCRESLNFFEQNRQDGVLVLRDAGQSALFANKLLANGFTPVVCPVIQIKPRGLTAEWSAALQKLPDYDWIVFTSPNGVKAFFNLYFAEKGDLRRLSQAKFAVIGQGTAEVLAEYGFIADFVPTKQVSFALAAGLLPLLKEGDKILLPRSAMADNDLKEKLETKGSVDDIKIYDTLISTEREEELKTLLQTGEVKFVPFTSASTVDGFMKACGDDLSCLDQVKTVAIGPITAKRMRELGITPDLEAAEHSLDGIVSVLQGD